MRIPRKDDLIRLQQQYRTDAKIAEALGGIPEYLVAYWRRKKGVPRLTPPKFSSEQIAELWQRYGDDFRCGRELNISKPAFYSWRRKYGILEKPAVLKLEQIELRLDKAPEVVDDAHPEARTSAAKILARCRESWPHAPTPADWQIKAKSDEPWSPLAVSPGPIFQWPRGEAAPDTPELAPYGWRDPAWCLRERGSIVWQLIEANTILPGQLIFGPRQLLGGCGGIGTLVLDPVTGRGALRYVRVEVTRRLPVHAGPEDIIVAMLAHGWTGDIGDSVLEFVGGPVERLGVDQKVKLCSLAVAIGAGAAICPFDDMIRRHYGRLLQGRFPQTHPDHAARYDDEHFIEGRSVEPMVAVWGSHGTLAPIPPDQAKQGGVIVGPQALPYEIELAASLVEGRTLGAGSAGTLLVCPATVGVHRLTIRRGWAQTIINAGGSVLDVGLRRRLGIGGLLSLAAGTGPENWVYLTDMIEGTDRLSGPTVAFAGARTAIERSGILR